MTIILVLVFICLAVGFLLATFDRGKTKPAGKTATKTIASKPRATARPYADITTDEGIRDLTKAEIDEMFRPFREALRRHKPMLKTMEKAIETDKPTPALIADGRRDLEYLKADEALLARLQGSLTFERDSAYERFSKFEDDFGDFIADFETAVDTLEDLWEELNSPDDA